jgi:hypothetical protein
MWLCVGVGVGGLCVVRHTTAPPTHPGGARPIKCHCRLPCTCTCTITSTTATAPRATAANTKHQAPSTKHRQIRDQVLQAPSTPGVSPIECTSGGAAPAPPPQSRQTASPECPPPSWDQLQSQSPPGARGGANFFTAPRQTTRRPGEATNLVALARGELSIAATNGLRAALRAVRGMTQCPLATGMTKISRPKGKYSAHQAAPKHLTNNSLFCSESSNSRRYAVTVSALSYVPVLFIAVQESISYKLVLYRSNSRHR